MPATITPLMRDERVAAKAARLRYVNDAMPGIRRRRAGRGFTYVEPDGQRVRDPEILVRIKKLAIPPAWTDVWICLVPNGHIQATGRDDRGRKQYRYHDQWRAVRDLTKYERSIAFGQALPRIRQRVEQDLARPGLCREKVLAVVIRLLETTLIRVGNRAYVRENGSFGLTTFRDRHARIDGTSLRFHFRGKSGKEHRVGLRDRRLSRIVRQCQELPGQELFQYLDAEGARQAIDSDDVNQYLREIAGEEFTAKDFRTWYGTVLAAQALAELADHTSKVEAKKNVAACIKQVAERLGNTPTICRKCYVHPAVVDAYLEGVTVRVLRENHSWHPPAGLPEEETLVLGLLQRHLAPVA